MSKIIAWVQQLNFDSVIEMIVVVAASLLCITVHETCHGLVAYWLGDDTAKRQGRLSLNPLRHVDVAGLIMMAFLHFGWAKPVPVDMRNFRNPKAGMALTALAGPVSNVLLALLAMIVRAVLLAFYAVNQNTVLYYVLFFVTYVAILSAGLAVFNLFPIPPLDGSKVLFYLLPDRYYDKLMQYERYGMLLLMVLLLTNVLDRPLDFLQNGLMNFFSVLTEPISIFVYNLLI